METDDNGSWKPKALILGGVVGALMGVGLAYLLVRRSEETEGGMKFGAGEGLRLGVILANVLRQVAQLGDGSG
jgi:hypothetical protein